MGTERDPVIFDTVGFLLSNQSMPEVPVHAGLHFLRGEGGNKGKNENAK